MRLHWQAAEQAWLVQAPTPLQLELMSFCSIRAAGPAVLVPERERGLVGGHVLGQGRGGAGAVGAGSSSEGGGSMDVRVHVQVQVPCGVQVLGSMPAMQQQQQQQQQQPPLYVLAKLGSAFLPTRVAPTRIVPSAGGQQHGAAAEVQHLEVGGEGACWSLLLLAWAPWHRPLPAPHTSARLTVPSYAAAHSTLWPWQHPLQQHELRLLYVRQLQILWVDGTTHTRSGPHPAANRVPHLQPPQGCQPPRVVHVPCVALQVEVLLPAGWASPSALTLELSGQECLLGSSALLLLPASMRPVASELLSLVADGEGGAA